MNGQPQINVLVVEDHPMTRAGLELFLDAYPDLNLLRQVESGEEALEFCEQIQPDVILMDMKLVGMDGVATTAAIKQRYRHVQVIALSSFQDKDLVERAVQAGAISYLLKTATAQELVYAIRAARAGRSVLSQEATDALVQSVRRLSGWGDLTEREREVVALLAEGLTNAQIAERLTVSLATAKFHVGGVLSKLGVSNRAEAVTLYWQHQLVGQTGPLEGHAAQMTGPLDAQAVAPDRQNG
jgi:NarL family two-component system response regulator LiaR